MRLEKKTKNTQEPNITIKQKQPTNTSMNVGNEGEQTKRGAYNYEKTETKKKKETHIIEQKALPASQEFKPAPPPLVSQAFVDEIFENIKPKPKPKPKPKASASSSSQAPAPV